MLTLAATSAIALVGAAACERERAPLALDTADAHATHALPSDVALGPEVSRWLAGIRQATAAFHDIETAKAAGFDTALTGCMELPGTGGMGYHYGNVALIDDTPEEYAPELLVYEPQKNGRMRLVAVEFIVPITPANENAPPSLHGVAFHRNDAFGLWIHHAWIWQNNKAGIFADWNPDVSCKYDQPQP
jgi:hypothetical protein